MDRSHAHAECPDEVAAAFAVALRACAAHGQQVPGHISAVALEGDLELSPSAGLRLLRLVEDFAGSRHLHHQLQLSGHHFIVTFAAEDEH